MTINAPPLIKPNLFKMFQICIAFFFETQKTFWKMSVYLVHGGHWSQKCWFPTFFQNTILCFRQNSRVYVIQVKNRFQWVPWGSILVRILPQRADARMSILGTRAIVWNWYRSSEILKNCTVVSRKCICSPITSQHHMLVLKSSCELILLAFLHQYQMRTEHNWTAKQNRLGLGVRPCHSQNKTT